MLAKTVPIGHRVAREDWVAVARTAYASVKHSSDRSLSNSKLAVMQSSQWPRQDSNLRRTV